MHKKSMKSFFISIVLPSFLAISLFTGSLYAVLIPMFEQSMMQRKKEMISELTNTAWSILDEEQQAFQKQKYSLEEAQNRAIRQIEKMRYGKERKDYFWIIDYQPKMIMHPYRKDLNNTDLSGYVDSHQNKLFVDAIKLVDSKGFGFLEYYWQWKDDETQDVPKLSFVKDFKAWGWVLGTGIYLEDVRAEISKLKSRLFKVSSFIVGIICLLLLFLVRQSLAIETKRKKAEESLKKSRLKYKSLVEASNEGALMIMDSRVVFANRRFMEEYIPSGGSLLGCEFDEVFDIKMDNLVEDIQGSSSSSFETQILVGPNKGLNVVIHLSNLVYSNSSGYIVIVKNVNHKQLLDLSSKKLSNEVEFSLQLMHQSIEPFVKEAVFCDLETDIQSAALLMQKKRSDILFVRSHRQVIGVVNSNDLKNRVLAEGQGLEQAISNVMTSPVLCVDSEELVYEAKLKFKNWQISHLLVKDEQGILGALSYKDCLEAQQNTLSYLVEQVKNSNSIKQLKELYAELPSLVGALVSSSDNIAHLTRLITAISEEITVRVIEMAKEQMGEAPCKFAFVSTGSVGRSEQVLKTDQDNAIIYEDGFVDVNEYFLKLAEYINNSLSEVGYSSCKGLIMAKNPKWCLSLGDWKSNFEKWIENKDVEGVLNCKIFFDMKLSYGDEDLVKGLRSFFTDKAKENKAFLSQMAQSIMMYKSKLKGDTINLKEVMVPMLGYLRIMAIYSGINETNSILRLYRLFEKGMMTFELCQEIETSYEFLMHQRVKLHSRQLMQNETPENEISVDRFTSIERSVLDKIQEQIQKLQVELVKVFGLS